MHTSPWPLSVRAQLVVLCAVQHLGLQGGIHITEAHGGGRAAQQLHHPHVGGRLLDADLQAVQVRGGVDGGVDGVEVAGAGVQPGDGLEAGLLGGLKDGPHDVGVVHRGVVCLGAGEQVGQVEQGVVLRESLQQGVDATQKVMAPVWVSWTISFWEPSSSLGKIWMSYLSPSLPLMNSWKASSPVWVGWLVDWLCPMRMISSPLLPEPAQPASPPRCQSCHRRHE